MVLAAGALGCAQNDGAIQQQPQPQQQSADWFSWLAPKKEKDPAASYRRPMYTPDYAKLYDNPSVYDNAESPKAAEEYRKMLRDLAGINRQLQNGSETRPPR